MRTKLSMIAAAAMIFSLASCSVNDIEKPGVADKTVAYAKVAISMPKSLGTRADVTPGDGGVDPGDESESKLSSIHLALYDQRGTYVGNGELISEMPEYSEGKNDNVSHEYEMEFELTLDKDGEDPTQMVAFINTPLNTSNLTDLQNNGVVTTGIYATTGTGKDDGFIMTNAGYVEGSNYVIAKEIGDAIYHNDDEKANAPTVELYVERLAAKITVQSTPDNINQDAVNYVVKDVNGKPVKLEYTPTFWGATGKAQKENYVKTAFTVKEWMKGSYRTYWAESVHYDKDLELYTTGNSANDPLTYLTFGDIKDTRAESKDNMKPFYKTGSSDYVLEHTSKYGFEKEDNFKEDLRANTYVIVTGEYAVKVEDVKDETVYKKNETVDFYLLLAGEVAEGSDKGKKAYTIYNESQLIGLLLSYNGVTAVGPDAGTPGTTSVKDANFEFNNYFSLKYDFEKGKYVLAENEDKAGDLYDQDGELINIDGMSESTNSRHYYFPEGGAYFNVPIAQNQESDNMTYGVVRNHSYVLDITAIQNLGAPLDENNFKKDETEDPDPTPVVPDPDDFKDNYIKATIKVLSWHVTNNNVVL